jgi:uncharacterized protein
VSRLSTYLPPWAGPSGTRTAGIDEDAVTMAVAAGLAAQDQSLAQRVVVVTRQPTLLEGGSAAVLCAGLGLAPDTEVVERLGGAAAALDAVATAASGTLVVGVDVTDGAGAGAVLVGDEPALGLAGRVQRSLPIRTRFPDGSAYQDDDARLVRERGTRASLEAADLPDKPQLIAGLSARDAKPFTLPDAPPLATTGASSPFFALAAMTESGSAGLLVAIEQATLTAVSIVGQVDVIRVEPAAQPIPARKEHPGGDIKFALTAYDRAFEPKLHWQAGRCTKCATLAFPPRRHCLGCRSDDTWELTALPRTGEVYTTATIHVPVPSLQTPYTLAVVELDDVDVRALVTVTDVPPSVTDIGDRGRMVLRRVALRSGVPDYGYAFSPDPKEQS